MTPVHRRPRALLAVLVLVLALLTAGGGAGAAATRPQATPGDVWIELMSLTPAVLTPADLLTVTATVHNDTDAPIEGARAGLAASSGVTRTRSAIETWVGRPTGADIGRTVTAQDLGTLEPGASVTVTFTVSPADLNLGSGSDWGTRALAVAVESADVRLAALRTFTAWDPGAEVATPIGLTVLAAVTGPPVNAQDDRASATSLAAQTAETGRLGRLLEATAAAPEVGWVIDPALVRAALVDPASAGWANRLLGATGGRDVAALPAYDLDLAAFAHHPGATVPDDPTPATDTAADPTASWRRDIAWPADATPDVATIALGASLGATTAVIGAGMGTPDDMTYTPSGVAGIATAAGTVTALVADDTLGDLLAASGPEATQRLLAETAVIARERPNQARELLATLDRGWDPDVASFEASTAALGRAPWVRFSTVDALRQTPVPDIARESLPDSSPSPDEIGADALDDLQSARGRAADFAVVAVDPTAVTAPLEPGLVVPTAIAYRSERAARQRAVTAGVAAVDAVVTDSIRIVPRKTVTLFAEDVNFPVLIHNDLPQPVTVEVALVPQGTGLQQSDTHEVTIPAHSEVSDSVPVKAIASGIIIVEVQVRAPHGGPQVAAPIDTRVVLSPRLDTVGTWVFVVAVALLLVGGIVRTVRRGHSPHRTAGVPTEPVVTAEPLP